MMLPGFNLVRRMGNSEPLRHMAFRFGSAAPPKRRSGLEAFRSVAEFPWLEHAWEENLENLMRLKPVVEALEAEKL